MGELHVVVGSGPDALRTAAALAHIGHQVHLVQQSDTPSGLRHPDLPVGTGLIQVAPEHRQIAEAVLGPLVEGPDPERSVVANQCIERLPLGLGGMRRAMPRSVLWGVGKNWLRARGRNAMAEVVGGGMEERSHKDWVVRRMGEPAWHHLYRSYAERRWGLPSEQLSVSLARMYHGGVDDSAVQVVGGGYDQALEQAEKCLLAAGGTVSCGHPVTRVECKDGRVRSVHLGDESIIDFDGHLWVCAAPKEVSGWLGEQLPVGIQNHAKRCVQLSATRVALTGETRDMPMELHILDDRASFWRVTSPYGIENVAVFHLTHPVGSNEEPDDAVLAQRIADEAAAIGIRGFDAQDARVDRLPAWQPQWGPVAHSWIRTVLKQWSEMGIMAVGRGGAMAALDPGQEIGLVIHLANAGLEGQQEIHRVHTHPPVAPLDLEARLSRFVVR